ncbi:MAG: aldehyde ferredoxin oxidoreductase family protein [Parasporobacterium sp.]|nr:aldehyde ferredoxin oxidoreductase family protein [Parasporobacterium sp.]
MGSTYGGYMGRVIKINLTTKEVSDYPWSDRDRELFIGGKTMADKILYDCLTGKEKAFSEENMLIVSTGPLTGTGAPSASRYNMSAISPQTNIIGTSNCGGSFGYYLKKAGFDALILTGKCEKHSWIVIDNDNIEFRDADEDGLWGLKTTPAQERIREILIERWGEGRAFGQMSIGPAGENLVLYSAVISDERASGRTGMGAVMGWKNLKGVAVTGNHDITVKHPARTDKWNQKWFKYLKEHPLTGTQMPRMGTAGLVSQMQMRGLLSTRNYSQGKFDDFEMVNGETLAEDHNIVNKGCMTCPIKCARTVDVEGREVKGPELETMGLLGGGIMNNDLYKLLKWNNELDELGMDTISCASTVAYAMEANEKGLWDNGLKFGETDGISDLFEDIAHRRGIGDDLANGSKRCAEKYGGMEFAIQSKGLELAAYEPRQAVGQGLGYAVANRGGCHLNGGYLVIVEGLGLFANPHTPHAKADFTMLFQDLMEMISASGQCLFTSYSFFPAPLITNPNGVLARIVNKAVPFIGWALRLINKCPRALAIHLPIFHHPKGFMLATGIPMNFGKYIYCGERGYTLERALDAKFGASAKIDTLPKRLTDVPQDPANPKSRVPLETMKKTYYHARGWDDNGVPTVKTLKKLKVL